MFINAPQTCPKRERYAGLKIPLGFLYMGGFLEKHNLSVKILDAPLYYRYRQPLDRDIIRIGLPFELIRREISVFNPGIIGMGCSFSSFEDDVFDLIREIKKYFPDIWIVVGGAHVSANQEFVMRNEDIDIAVTGEGEKTILEIAKVYPEKKEFSKIKGIAFRESGRIKINEKRDYIKNLDDLKAAWHLIDLERYFSHPDNSMATMRRRSLDIITSRGCPGRCVFCAIHTVWNHAYRSRSAKNVVDEIEMLYQKYRVSQFRIQDDNLTLDKRRILEICSEMARRNLDIRWDTPNGVAVWTLDEAVLQAMKKAGCYRITFGIESGSKKTIEYIGKKTNLDKINRLIDYCHTIGMWVCATFIIGFPKETKSDINATIDFLANSKINFPFIYIAQPLPGAKMYEDFKNHGLLKEIQKTSTVSKTRYHTLSFSSEQLNALRRKAYHKFYLKKIASYLNPFNFYLEFLSKIKRFEDVEYVLKMFKSVLSVR